MSKAEGAKIYLPNEIIDAFSNRVTELNSVEEVYECIKGLCYGRSKEDNEYINLSVGLSHKIIRELKEKYDIEQVVPGILKIECFKNLYLEDDACISEITRAFYYRALYSRFNYLRVKSRVDNILRFHHLLFQYPSANFALEAREFTKYGYTVKFGINGYLYCVL